MKTTNKQRFGSQAFLLALAATPVVAQAQSDCDSAESACDKSSQQIELVEVYGVENAPYRASQSGDMRRLAELAELPQTLNILTQQQILDSGKTDLKEILSAQAGITLGTGENGNAFGDRYVIRGHEARSDVFVDGLRDPGMTTRESFASEQVEITKGPSATFAGRGSSGGAVNSITKRASTDQGFNRVDAAVGSDDYHRIVVDSNVVINEDNAVRVNLLHADETTPNRDGIEQSRQGVLLSGITQPSSQLSIAADVYYLNAQDVPDLGSYFDSETRKPVRDIPVYAQEGDFLNTEVTAVTFHTQFEVNEDLRFSNATRWGKTSNGYMITGARGTTRDASDTEAPGAATISLSNHQGWQKVDYAATQFNGFWDTSMFGLDSSWVFGAEFTDETVENGQYQYDSLGDTNCVTSGRRGASAGYCALDSEGNLVANVRQLIQRDITGTYTDAKSEIETVSLYVMNKVQLLDSTELFFGARQDSFDYSNTLTSSDGTVTQYGYSDDLLNAHVGLVQDLAENGNVYVTYSTATNINGGETDVGGSCGYGGLCGDTDQVGESDPERVENIELGTKWELFNDKLLASAAVFQITKSDVMESVGDDYESLGTLNTGKNRVEGVEVSLTGAITDQLSVQFSATSMSSEVLESYTEDNVGLVLSNFADQSAYLQLRYQPSDSYAVGAAATYQSEMYAGQPDTAAGYNSDIGDYSIVVPSYTVYDLFANYYYSENINFRLNIGNVTDKEYWTAAYRSGAFMYLGEGRSVRTSVTWKF